MSVTYDFVNLSTLTIQYSNTTWTLNPPTSRSTGAFTFYSSNESVATISGRIVTIIGTGSTTLTSIQQATATYKSAVKTMVLFVTPLNTVLTGFDDMVKKISDENFTLIEPTSNSVGSFFYTSSNELVAEVYGDVVKIVGIGVSEITAIQAETEYYSSASIISNLTVNKIDTILTNFDDITYLYSNEEIILEEPQSNNNLAPFTYYSSDPEVALISGNTLRLMKTGTAVITATQPDTDYYNSASITCNITITSSIDPELSNFNISDKIYGDTSFELEEPDSASDGDFTFISLDDTLVSISGRTVNILKPGLVKITAIQAEKGIYVSSSIIAEFIINKAPPILDNISIPDKIIGDEPFELSYPNSNSNGAITFSSSKNEVATIVGRTVTVIGAGVTEITISQAETTNYLSAVITNIFNVSRANTILSNFNIPEKKFGDEQFELNKPVTNSDGAFIYSSLDERVATIVGSTVTVTGAGVTDITATQIETSNYLSETILTTISVIKATTILSNFNIPDQTVGNVDFDLEDPESNRLGTFIYTSSNPLVATIYGKTVRIMGAGYADITATQETTSDYFAETIITKLNVNKAPTTLTRDNFKDLTKTFGDLLFGLSAPVSNRPGLITYSSLNETVATIFESSVTILGAGTSVITAIQAETSDYLSETIELILTVNKALPTISNFFSFAKTIGDASFDLSATSDSSGAITYSSLNPEIATIVGNKVTIVAVGLAVITVSQAETDNHLAATQTLELTVNKAAPIISNFVDLFETFGNPSFDLSATSNSSGLFSYSSLDNTIATIVGNKLNIIGAGTTVISVLQAGTSNYLEATKTLNLTVYKAVPIISNFLSFSKTFGDSSFDLSATSSSPAAIIYSSSNTGVASVSGKNVTIVAAGLTVITVSQTETPNYLSTIQTLELTVNKATPTIINFSNLEKTFGDSSFDLSAPISDSPGLFSYSSSNTKVVSIIGKNVTIVGAGIATITATQAETDNYLAAPIDCLITILKRRTILSNFGNLIKIFGDNVFTLFEPTSDRMQFI